MLMKGIDGNTEQTLRINAEGQAYVLSEVHTEARHRSNDGDLYLGKSGYVTSSASADVFSVIYWLKNDSTTKDIHIGHLRTCNELTGRWRMIVDSTAVSSSTTVVPLNMNRGKKSNVLDATAEYGVAGATLTGGAEIATWINADGHSTEDFAGSIILGANDTIAFEYAPFAATANPVCVTMEIWQPSE